MGSSPQRQVMQSKLEFSLPVTFVQQDDVLNALNSIPPVVFDDALAGVITIDQFLNRNIDVTSLTVSKSHWINVDGKATLVSNITTISDPLSAGDLAAIIVGAALVIIAAILAVLASTGIFVVPVVITLALVAVGVLTLITVTVSVISGAVGGLVSTPGGLAVLLLGGAVAVGGIAYLATRPGAGRRLISLASRI